METITVALIGGAVALAALAVVAHRRRTKSTDGAGRSGSGRRSSAPSERSNGPGSGETTRRSSADSGPASNERGRDRTGGSGLAADVERQLSAGASASSGGSSATTTRSGSTARGASGTGADDAGSLDDIWASSSEEDLSTDPDDLLDADEALEEDWRQADGDEADEVSFESSGGGGYRARTDRGGDPDDDLDSVFS
jgi:hypothetical protein